MLELIAEKYMLEQAWQRLYTLENIESFFFNWPQNT